MASTRCWMVTTPVIEEWVKEKMGGRAGGHEDVDIDPGFSVSLPSSAVRELV